MFKIAKNVQTNNELVEVKIVDAKCGKYVDGKSVYNIEKELEVNISGNINNDKYCLYFIIKKPIEEYFEIEKGEKYNLNTKNLIENYLIINDVTYFDITTDIDIIRLGDKFMFLIFFKDSDNEFFGTVEFSIDLKDKLNMYN